MIARFIGALLPNRTSWRPVAVSTYVKSCCWTLDEMDPRRRSCGVLAELAPSRKPAADLLIVGPIEKFNWDLASAASGLPALLIEKNGGEAMLDDHCGGGPWMCRGVRSGAARRTSAS